MDTSTIETILIACYAVGVCLHAWSAGYVDEEFRPKPSTPIYEWGLYCLLWPLLIFYRSGAACQAKKKSKSRKGTQS